MGFISNESIQGFRLLIELIKIAKKEIKELVDISRKVTKSMKFETSKDFKNLDKEIDEVTKATKQLIELEREDARLKKDLANATKAEQQALKAKNTVTIQARKEEERQIKIATRLANEKKKLTSIYARESARLNTLRKRYKDLALSENGASTATRKLQREIQALDNKLKKVDADVGQFQRSIGDYKQALAGSLGTVGQFATGVGAIAAGVAIAGKAISSAIDIIKGFEQANANLKAVTGATAEEMKALSTQAKQLGASTAFTASEVTGLQTEFAKLGFPTRDIQLMTQSTLDASVAMGSDLGEQAKLTGATLKSFGLDASEAKRVNDVLAEATRSSALDFQKLASSMSTIAPVANAFGFSLEGTTALLGQLSSAGFDASSAATATRNILLNLADSSSKLGKSLKEPVTDLPSLVRGLKQLKAEGTDLGKALELTDKRSVAAFSTFLEGTDVLLELNEKLVNVQDTAAEMAAVQLDTLEGSVKILNSSWEGLILSMEDGNGIMTEISRVVIDDLAKGLSIISGESKEAKKEFSLLGLVLTSAKQSLAVFIGVLKILAIPMTIAFNLAKKLAQRFGLISESVGGIKEALQTMIQILNNLPEITNIVVNSIVKAFSRISDVIFGIVLIFKGFFSTLTKGFAAVGRTIVGFGKLLGTVVLKGITGDTEAIKKAFKAFGNTIGKEFLNLAKNKDILEGSRLIAETFTSGLGDFEEAKRLIKALFEDDDDTLKKEAEKLGEDLGDAVVKGFKSEISKLRKTIKDELEDEESLRIEPITLEIEVDPFELSKNAELIATARQQLLDLDKKLDEEELARKKEQAQKLRAIIKEFAAFQKEKFNENQKRLDDEIKGSEDQQKRLQRLADQGSETAELSRASEEKRNRDLRLQKQRELEKQKQTELLFKGLDVFAANLAQGQNAGQAAANTVTTITLLGQALRGIPFFKKGTEDTGTVANPLDSSGGRIAVLHDNERVVDRMNNLKMKGFSNHELGNLAESYKQGELVQAEQNKINILRGSYLSNDRVLEEIEKSNELLKEVSNNISKQGLTVDIVKGIMTFSDSRNGKNTNTHFKINNRRSWS